MKNLLLLLAAAIASSACIRQVAAGPVRISGNYTAAVVRHQVMEEGMCLQFVSRTPPALPPL